MQGRNSVDTGCLVADTKQTIVIWLPRYGRRDSLHPACVPFAAILRCDIWFYGNSLVRQVLSHPPLPTLLEQLMHISDGCHAVEKGHFDTAILLKNSLCRH